MRQSLRQRMKQKYHLRESENIDDKGNLIKNKKKKSGLMKYLADTEKGCFVDKIAKREKSE